MKNKQLHKQPRGQSMVEFVLVLPFLLIMFLGMIEAGYALYDYIVIANANREGVRLAARGQFTDQNIQDRIIAAGGYKDETLSSALLNDEENFGFIITHIPFPETLDPSNPTWANLIKTHICCTPDCNTAGWDRNDINVTICFGGVTSGAGTVREVDGKDSHITDVGVDYGSNVAVTGYINELRMAEDYEPQMNEIVVVETFLTHSMLLHVPDFVPFDDPFTLYFRSSMRVTLNSRQ